MSVSTEDDKTLSNVEWLRKYGYYDDDKDKLRDDYLANVPHVDSEEEVERKIRGRKTAQTISGLASLMGALANVGNVSGGAVNQQITPQFKDIDYDAIREKYRQARKAIGAYRNKANEYVQGILDKRASAAAKAAGVVQGERNAAERERHNKAMEDAAKQKRDDDMDYKEKMLDLRGKALDNQKDYNNRRLNMRVSKSSHTSGTAQRTTDLYIPETGTTYTLPAQSYDKTIQQLAAISGIPLTTRVKVKDEARGIDGNVIAGAEYKEVARPDKELLRDIIKAVSGNKDLQDALDKLSVGKSVDSNAAKRHNKVSASEPYRKAARRTVYPLYIKGTGKTEYFSTPESREARKKARAKEVEEQEEQERKAKAEQERIKISNKKKVLDTFV